MHDQHSAVAVRAFDRTTPGLGTALVIGRTDSDAERHLLKSHATIVACSPTVLDRPILDRVLPASVAFPLMATGFDAAQIVVRLSEAGFSGTAVIFAPRLPNREMVLRELRAMAPGLSIRLVERQSD